MFKQLLNEFRVNLSLLPQGPVLIKSGNALSAGTDMSFVKTFRNNRSEVYLPGSSLKGVIRSHAEKIGRTFNEKAICNPFNTSYTQSEHKNPSHQGVPSCSDAFRKLEKAKQKVESHDAYRGACPTCQLFGSLAMAGRFNIRDAYVAEGTDAPLPEYRDGVGIDRFSGGAVPMAKFDFEVITSGEFFTTLTITNFELWQISLVAYVLQDFVDGLISIGMGTSRGLGMVTGKIQQIEVDVLSLKTPEQLQGIHGLYQGNDRSKYGFAKESSIALPDEFKFVRKGVRQRLSIGETQVTPFFETLQEQFPKFIETGSQMKQWRHEHRMSI